MPQLIYNKNQLKKNCIQDARNELINKSAIGLQISANKINNIIIDALVNNVLKNKPEVFNESIVRNQVESLYYKELQPYYQSLLTDKRTSNDILTKINVNNRLKENIFKASNRTMQAINNNRDFVKNSINKILKQNEANAPLNNRTSYMSNIKKEMLKEYEKTVGSKPVASRINILDEAGKAIGSKYGGNKGKAFFYVETPQLSYRQIGRIAYNVKREAIEHTKFEKGNLINEERIAEGRDPMYIAKKWNPSGNPNTRHSNMEGQIVPYGAYFNVENDKTGEKAELMYPQDYANDPSCANSCNCGCGFDRLTKRQVIKEGLDPRDFLT